MAVVEMRVEHEELEPLPRIRHPQLGEPATVYRYVDVAGDLVHVVCRWQLSPTEKTFRQARLEKGRWVWDLKDVERVLYRLPRVLDALAAGERIYIAEGEKDVDAIEASGAVATCNPMGAGPGKFTQAMAEQLRGIRYATIVIDKDDESKRDTPESRIAKDQSPKGADNLTPGERHALAIRDLLLAETGIASADIQLVQAATGKDPYDHLAAGLPLSMLEPWIRPAAPATAQVSAGLPGHEVLFDGFLATDVGNAERLLALHGPDLRYVEKLSSWFVWNGRRWAEDEDGEAERRWKQTIRALHGEAVGQGDTQRRKLAVKHVLESEREPRIRGVLRTAQTQPGVPAKVGALDADPMLLNVENGTIDLRTGALLPHAREQLLTKLAPVSLDTAAACPAWLAFLETIFGGDTDLIAFVQRAVGYSLTGSTSAQVLPICFGAGANGKSTFLMALQRLLGDYAHQAPAEMLMHHDRGRGGATPDLADLHGRRFVAAIETGEGRRLDEALVKQLTGGDAIRARRLYSPPFTFVPTHKLWLATNHRPEIRGGDHAIWRRLALIPFEVTIAAGDQIDQAELLERFHAEAAGILNWALDGTAAWLAHGLEPPGAVQAATSTYRADMDVLGDFIDECCVVHDDAHVKSGALYYRYEYWCTANGVDKVKQKTFSSRLIDRGFVNDRTNQGRIFRGISIRHDEGHDA